jgi:hypothetical protein
MHHHSDCTAMLGALCAVLKQAEQVWWWRRRRLLSPFSVRRFHLVFTIS